jgi:hypothetical protein
VLDRATLVRRLRAALIAVALVANATHALPYSDISPEDRAKPDYGQPALDLWWGWFGPALPVARETFDGAVRWAWFAGHDVVHALRAPFHPFFSLFHLNQQWGLFAVVTEDPDALLIEVRRGGDNWSVLYRRLDGDKDWHDRQLKYRRIRGVWDGVKDEPKGTYKRMSTWIARMIFTEMPKVDRVRVSLERTHLSLPWEPVDATRSQRAERYFRRNEVMGPKKAEPQPAEPPQAETEPKEAPPSGENE